MPGKEEDDHLHQPFGAQNYPLGLITLAGLPAIIIPQKIAEDIALRYLCQAGRTNTPAPLSHQEETEFSRYGCKSRLPIFIPGDTANRASNIIWINAARLQLGDVPFALFLRLVAELYKNKGGMIRKSRLINAGYIKPDGEYQSISRLRQNFRGVLNGLDPQDFIETCRPGYLRLSTHPAFITYDKAKLLSHRNTKIRRLARQLP